MQKLLSVAILLGAVLHLQGCGGSDADAEKDDDHDDHDDHDHEETTTAPTDDDTATTPTADDTATTAGPTAAPTVIITSGVTLGGLTLAQAQAAELPIKTGIATALNAALDAVAITGFEEVAARLLQSDTTAAPAAGTTVKVSFTVTVPAAEGDATSAVLTAADSPASFATAIQTAITTADATDFTDASLVADIQTAAADITVASLVDPAEADATTATPATDAPIDAATTEAPTNSTSSGERRLTFDFVTEPRALRR